MVILIDNGHGFTTKGKSSPDNKLREYEYCRMIAKEVHKRLLAKGYDARLVTPETSDVSITTRVKRVNLLCKNFGAKKCVLVSIHNNASGADGKWHTASGFSVFCSKNASSNSKSLARIFTKRAKSNGMLGNRSVPADGYWTWSWTTADIGILKQSNCPAVLTECFFMDNISDLSYLLSQEGREQLISLHIDSIEEYIQSLK